MRDPACRNFMTNKIKQNNQAHRRLVILTYYQAGLIWVMKILFKIVNELIKFFQLLR